MEYRALFREHGIKCTPSRLRVFQVLEETPSPLAAQEIYETVNDRGHIVDLSTVYRILSAFVERGLVSRTLVDGDDKALFEVKRYEHKHHFVCLRCKEVFPLAGCPLEQYEQNLGQDEGFVVEGHKLEIYGYCPNCKGKDRREQSR